ncbi:MAG TPA: hypothetical protein VFN87_01840 [Solirubrobacteraceae bacterium]|nr:hypothetical protein [Solirubrobacteraceae bacterium]
MRKAKAGAARKAAKAATHSTAVVPSGVGKRVARRAAAYGLRKLTERVRETGGEVLRLAATRAVEEGREVIHRAVTPQLPIQRSIDIAVPVHVAWREWMELETLPEGVHRVRDLERDGGELTGVIDGDRDSDWRAEILDERQDESFAWRSVEGSDCAGLITFHQLSERLTRIELNLDVLPTTPADVVALRTHLAHRRADIDLRRFKAHLELINPDLYDEDQ